MTPLCVSRLQTHGAEEESEQRKTKTTLRYLEIGRQLVGGEDAQFDLREADLQVLKVVARGRSGRLAGLLVQVFVQSLQLCVGYSGDLDISL